MPVPRFLGSPAFFRWLALGTSAFFTAGGCIESVHPEPKTEDPIVNGNIWDDNSDDLSVDTDPSEASDHDEGGDGPGPDDSSGAGPGENTPGQPDMGGGGRSNPDGSSMPGDANGRDDDGSPLEDDPPEPSPCLTRQRDRVAPSTLPPDGLAPQRVPQFVMFGFEDNADADGVNWVVNDLFAGRKNPDGSRALATFFIIGGAATREDGVFTEIGGQSEGELVDAWRNAYAAGHELANHSWDHLPSRGGRGLSVSGWSEQIQKAHTRLLEQLQIPACELAGFRFPHLEFNDHGFSALESAGYVYDTSMEFGYEYWYPPPNERGNLVEGQGYASGSPESSAHFWWPFTLDEPIPSNYQIVRGDVSVHPGVWAFPLHVFVKITQGTAQNIKGLDDALWQKAAHEWSFDFCDVLKQTFDQHYNNNRSPMNVGLHSDLYSQYNAGADAAFNNTFEERRAGLRCFLDYVLSKSDARVVPFKQVIRWLRNPTPL